MAFIMGWSRKASEKSDDRWNDTILLLSMHRIKFIVGLHSRKDLLTIILMICLQSKLFRYGLQTHHNLHSHQNEVSYEDENSFSENLNDTMGLEVYFLYDDLQWKDWAHDGTIFCCFHTRFWPNFTHMAFKSIVPKTFYGTYAYMKKYL